MPCVTIILCGNLLTRHVRTLIVWSFIREIRGKAIPLQAWTGPRLPEGLGSQISRQSVYEDGKFVSPTHRPPLSPGNITGAYFC